MVVKSGTLDDWRDYFRSANSDIFDVIEQAILIAASDYPNEFRSRRDRIAERLFSARLTRCIGCDRVELTGVGGRGGGGGSERSAKESKVNSSTIDQEEKLFHKSVYSYDEAEALTDEMEEETQMVGEVLRIREVLEQKNDESESMLFDSLRRLEIMQLSVDTLKATEIGKAVNGLRKHNSKRIRHLVRTLIDGWKDLVDAWVSSTAAIAETTPDSINPSVLDEELGLPFPPLDEGALLATQTAPMELSKFFDGMDDDGSEFNKLEIAKRKLHEGYQLAENAKKQRTIQVMELRDLPKQGLPQRHTHVKPGMQNRYKPNVRR
ncbi:putative mediator of RNA polymerase II transcription subunit 26b [Acorus gramineus]|uniref:Mediator of RNA polymerase II transcription subunit 26b n=1 Tax=Acorus gramineus TaxID=55184 RepID=A0AAV9BV05_ACOGR|nr:putative mediator of RNA polymerase II transcription subunit 26b [Acorus gramineus]KAK1280871.1 putative mediator of RNA polymerase II transcription subunit 26b [Acorus gramineus]